MKRHFRGTHSAGAGAGAGRGTSMLPLHIRNASFYRGGFMEMGQRQQQHVKGKGVLRGKNKRTPKAIVYNKRIQQNMPLTVAHEVKQELRSVAGSQAVVTAIAERLLPRSDYSGRLVDNVNRTDTGTLRGFINSSLYQSATADAPTAGQWWHRNDWTMFTNATWRDGYAFANGQFNSTGNAAGAMGYGYGTPYGPAGEAPVKWYEAPATLIDPTGNTREAVVEENPDASTATPAVMSMLMNYYHLYEEISWRFTNNSVTGTSVTIYECVLNRDIALRDTLNNSGTATVAWGGMPCPLELWRQSQALRFAQGAGLTHDGDLYYTSAPAAPDGAEAEGAASAQMQTNPTSSSVNQGMGAKDIDYPNVLPHKAQLLHTYYKVIPHTRYLPPGASTTITIGVKYNKRVPGAWWNTLYGVSGMSRAFFLVSRPDEVVGVTGADENPTGPVLGTHRLPVMNATDLMISWTKKKTVARTKQRNRRMWMYKAAIPEIDDVAVRNPVTFTMHDADVPMGTLAEEGVQQEDP